MLLITWIIKQWFSECHLLFTMEQHLSLWAKSWLSPEEAAGRQHICALFCHPTQMATFLGTPGHWTSAPTAQPFLLGSPAAIWQQPVHWTTTLMWSQLVWFWDLIVTICSASICSIFYSYLFCYSFRNSFRNKSPCNSLTINTSLPEDISSRRDCHHQTISSIYYLLLSPMFNYSVQHRMSPSSALKLNFNPPPVLRSNFHGQPSLFKWEKEREAQKITSHEGIQLISFYTSSTPTVEDFIHPVKPKVPFSELSRQVFQKSMVNMLQTAHRQRKWSTKFKIIWLRQQQQMKVIFSHEGREFKSLIKMNVKWTARKVTSTVKCVLWALSRRSEYFQCKKGREILSETKEKGRISKDRSLWMQPAFSWKTVLKKRKFNNSWCNKDWLGLEFIEQNSSCTKQKMKLQVKMRFCATVRSQSTF